MQMTRTQYIRMLKLGAIVLAALVIIGYAAWRSLNYARGPEIEIFQPENGSTAASSTIDIIGRADRVNSLMVDGRSISLDQQGSFKDTLVVFPGVNIIAFDATDQFGRSTEKQIEVVR
jgi:hypothetical protein